MISLISIARFFLGVVLILMALISFGVWTAPAPVFGFFFAVAGICYMLLAVRITIQPAQA